LTEERRVRVVSRRTYLGDTKNKGRMAQIRVNWLARRMEWSLALPLRLTGGILRTVPCFSGWWFKVGVSTYQFRTKPVSLTRFRRFLRVFPPLDRCSHAFSSYDIDELMLRRVLIIRTLQKPRCQSSTAWRHGGYMITGWLETIKLSRSAKPGERWLTFHVSMVRSPFGDNNNHY